MRQYHGIEVGDLVKFKHHLDVDDAVHLVTRVWEPQRDLSDILSGLKCIMLDGGNDIQHCASNFIVISKGI